MGAGASVGGKSEEDAAALTARGEDCFRKYDYDSAIKLSSKAISTDPSLAAAWSCRGKARARQAKPFCDTGASTPSQGKTITRLLDLAIADCTEAIRLDSSLASPWCERGWARLCKQDHDGACSDCAEALRLDPSNQDILLCMRLVDAERLKNAANGI
eukprot:gnl/TRDRNA2_/TRDRNA2_94128_c0_seq2.p1 gnl/TRDRNA2_/TRDRNA2_94128_c0~~gnl/TRDRNA2_/TRDRNA2_94128_c0_seq2.p1  ORF type:complete len:175 (-),score=23.59 gnl/TRDRNA2_/TRDRNA2_94128_c0_seq2:96-569(-)